MQSSAFGVGIVGVGHCIPNTVLTNEEIELRTGLRASTILEKTGISTRYIAGDDDTASGMSSVASMQAIAKADILPNRLNLIVCCTFSGDYVYPATACKVQALIGNTKAGCFDVMANCTGFQVGLMLVSDHMYVNPDNEYGLVVGTALQSRYLRWEDPETAMYFGDGAGAAVLGQVPKGYGILANEVFSNSSVFDAVRLRGGGSSFPLRAHNIDQGLQYYEMNGMEVWKQVVQYQPRVIRGVLEKIGATIDDVDFFIFHQANLRLIEYLMGRMKQPMSKTYVNVGRIGNTADASLPIALSEAVQQGLIKQGQLVVISGVGAGFTFGATAMRWY